jgi:hypothetical protein
MRHSRYWQWLCVLLLAGASAACDEKLSDLTGPTPNLTPTFTSIQREIFNTTDASGRTACTQCHTNVGRTPAAGLNLVEGAAYSALVGRPSTQIPSVSLVAPGDPDNSYLVKKLDGAQGIVGLRMPRNTGPFLTPGQMAVIRRWIEQGAANN